MASSPSARTRAMICATGSETLSAAGTSARSSAAGGAASPSSEISSERMQPLQQGVDRFRLQLVRHGVGDHPGGANRDLLADLQPVLPQRGPGRGQIDDPLDETGQRRELDGALDLDDLGLAARPAEMTGGNFGVLGGDADYS